MATPYMEDQDASETLQRLQNLGRLDLTHMLHLKNMLDLMLSS